MAPKRSRRGAQVLPAAGPSTEQEQSPNKPPYTLVLYDEWFTTGVVNTSEMDTSEGVGSKCMAPDPVDWNPDYRSDEVFDAKIIAFGHSINYLYQLEVNIETGTIVLQDVAQTENVQIAKRRSKEVNERKKSNVANINSIADGMPSLFNKKDENSDVNQGTGEKANCLLQQLIQQGSNKEKADLRKTLLSISNHLATAENIDDAEEFESSEFVGSIVAAACQLQLSGTKDICAQTVPESAPKVIAPQAVAGPSRPLFYNYMRGLQTKRVELNLQCYDPNSTADMVSLIKNAPVYIDRNEKTNLPWVVPRTEDTPKRAKKPKLQGAVFPKEMVTILLKHLVPWDDLQKLTGSTLPIKLYNSIKTFINNRLPFNNKMSDTAFTLYITEGIREMKLNIQKNQQK